MTRFAVAALMGPWILLTVLISPASAETKPLPTIAALTPHSVEMLFEVGAGEQIIATVEFADYPEAANQIRRVGRYNHIDLEAMLVLQPDLIILSGDETNPGITAQLKKLGIPMLDSSVDKVDDIADRMAMLGRATGHPEQGEQAAARFRQRLAELRAQYRTDATLGVFFQVWEEPLTAGASSWLNQLIGDCGGHNVIANALSEYPQVSLEQVLVASPQVILKPTYHGSAEQERIDWHKWPEIPAIEHGQLYGLEADLINRTGPRVLQGMARICESLTQARQAYGLSPEKQQMPGSSRASQQ